MFNLCSPSSPQGGGWRIARADAFSAYVLFNRFVQPVGVRSACSLELASGWVACQMAPLTLRAARWFISLQGVQRCRSVGAQTPEGAYRRGGAASRQYSLRADRHRSVVVWLVRFNAVRPGRQFAAVSAFSTTNTAGRCGGLSWMFFDVMRGKKPSVVGSGGAVVGLVRLHGCWFCGIPQIILSAYSLPLFPIGVHFKATKTVLDDTLTCSPVTARRMVGMLLTGYSLPSCEHGRQRRLAQRQSGFFLSVEGDGHRVGYSFAVSYGIFKFVNSSSRYGSARKRGRGSGCSQHDEKYTQGTLLVATPEGLKEQEIM